MRICMWMLKYMSWDMIKRRQSFEKKYQLEYAVFRFYSYGASLQQITLDWSIITELVLFVALQMGYEIVRMCSFIKRVTSISLISPFEFLLSTGTALLECRKTPKGTEYVGKITTTSTGRTCQKWGDQHPHAHNFGDEDFGNETLDDVGNYCRNPDGDVLPWCFTTDPKVIFNYCYILMCDPGT